MSDTLRRVPELSLLSYVQGNETEKAKFIDQLFNGIKDYGFIILVDHTVDDKVVQDSYAKVHEFFHLDTATKEKYVSPAGGGQRGYTGFGIEHAKDNAAPDLKEFWHVGRDVPADHKWFNEYPENLWPEEVQGFRDSLTTLYNSLDKTSIILLEALGKALDVPENYFKNMIDMGNSILRTIHYPEIPADIQPEAVRAAAHEDINLITILVGATSSGLELLDRDGTWLPVATRPGQLIVDSGDMLKLITNDVIPATTHRVVNPDNAKDERYSMPFFVHPNKEAMLDIIPSCIGDGAKYQAINANEFLYQRLREIGLM
jgi:isopenicillin N synthase-like dioxygenase